ncbi:hypothetical protein MA9V1_215 [Chryseobacterium phage MA9V-1]|nr:hypothetical protein MA9V1_215 [Chryseobacterium phage MA9V-1]
MDIFLIKAAYKVGYDSFDSHVIAANSKFEVVELAIDTCADEGEHAWLVTNVIRLGTYEGNKSEPFVIISSFNAG